MQENALDPSHASYVHNLVRLSLIETTVCRAKQGEGLHNLFSSCAALYNHTAI